MQKYIPNFNPRDHLEYWNFMHVLLLLSVIKDINFFFFFFWGRFQLPVRACHCCLSTGQRTTMGINELPCWHHVDTLLSVLFLVVLVKWKGQQNEPKGTALGSRGRQQFFLWWRRKVPIECEVHPNPPGLESLFVNHRKTNHLEK